MQTIEVSLLAAVTGVRMEFTSGLLSTDDEDESRGRLPLGEILEGMQLLDECRCLDDVRLIPGAGRRGDGESSVNFASGAKGLKS